MPNVLEMVIRAKPETQVGFAEVEAQAAAVTARANATSLAGMKRQLSEERRLMMDRRRMLIDLRSTMALPLGIAAGAGAALIGLGTKSAMEMDTQSRRTAMLADLTVDSLERIKQAARSIASDPYITASTTQIMESSGAIAKWSRGNLADYEAMTTASQRLAKATGSDAGEIGTILTRVATNYRMTSGEAQGLADTVYTMSRRVPGDIAEWNTSLAQASGVGAQFGVSIQEIAAALETLSPALEGGRAGQSLAQLMTVFTKPSKGFGEFLRSVGADASRGLKGLGGWTGAMKLVADYAGEDEQKLSELGLEGRTFRAMMLLNADAGRTYLKNLEELTGAHGALEQALTSLEGPEEAAAKAHQQLGEAGKAFGEVFLPMVGPVAKGLADIFHWAASIPDPLKTLTAATIAGGTAVMGFAFAEAMVRTGIDRAKLTMLEMDLIQKKVALSTTAQTAAVTAQTLAYRANAVAAETNAAAGGVAALAGGGGGASRGALAVEQAVADLLGGGRGAAGGAGSMGRWALRQAALTGEWGLIAASGRTAAERGDWVGMVGGPRGAPRVVPTVGLGSRMGAALTAERELPGGNFLNAVMPGSAALLSNPSTWLIAGAALTFFAEKQAIMGDALDRMAAGRRAEAISSKDIVAKGGAEFLGAPGGLEERIDIEAAAKAKPHFGLIAQGLGYLSGRSPGELLVAQAEKAYEAAGGGEAGLRAISAGLARAEKVYGPGTKAWVESQMPGRYPRALTDAELKADADREAARKVVDEAGFDRVHAAKDEAERAARAARAAKEQAQVEGGTFNFNLNGVPPEQLGKHVQQAYDEYMRQAGFAD